MRNNDRSGSNIPGSEITPESLYRQRRRFMQQSGHWLLAAGAAGLAGPLAAAQKALPTRGDIGNTVMGPFSTSEQPTSYRSATSYNNFYEFGVDKREPATYEDDFKTRPWTVEIGGECAKPGTFDFDDLLAPHSLEDRVYRLRCVETWSMVIPWVGVPLGEVLKRFEPTSKAKYVAFQTLLDPDQMPNQRYSKVLDWPYREGLRMNEAMHPLALLAVGMYGKALLPQNGAPLRLVIPWKYGFKSIKSIVKIDFVEQRPVTSWNQSEPGEYGFYANVNPKVSHPRWEQSRERRIGDWFKRDTLMFNGYGDEVASLYSGMDLKKNY